MDRWEIEKKIAIHCLKNPKFKEKLLSNPQEAMRELFGKVKGFNSAMLANVRFVVHEEKKNEFHISIPLVYEQQSLSDQELERIAGGGGGDGGGKLCWGSVA